MHYHVLPWNQLVRLTTKLPLTLVLGFALPLAASAQDTIGDDSTVIYPASYFGQWGPRTAQDMLDRIPGQASTSSSGGFSGSGGNPSAGGRGLGSGSGGTDILIDGKRTAGKNNQAGGLMFAVVGK